MYTLDFDESVTQINKKRGKIVLNFDTGKQMDIPIDNVNVWMTKNKKRIIVINKTHNVQKQQVDIIQYIQTGQTDKLLETDFIRFNGDEESLLHTAIKMVEKGSKNAVTNLGIVLSQILKKNIPQLKKQGEKNLKNFVTRAVNLTDKRSKGFEH
jgi:uncharacterized membrane protein